MRRFVCLCVGVLLSCGGAVNEHCIECPGEECVCIIDTNGAWIVSPEVGE